MGREIRRVPKDWEHPKDTNGNYKPMYNATFAGAVRDWKEDFLKWENGTDPQKAKHPDREFWEWAGDPPDRESYRDRVWTKEEATCYQIYETVSEGTPTSPIFETTDEMAAWLVSEGYSKEAAKVFVREGWAPSMLLVTGEGLHRDIESCAHFKDKESS